jgi:hypothetical protein
MLAEAHIADITHVIQLAVAPVFLLTAVGTLIAVLTNRLGRAIDRSRVLEDRLGTLGAAAAEAARSELGILARRIRLVYLAISLAVICALFVCLLIAGAFIGTFIAVDLSRLVGGMFVLAMVALIGSLTVFLREIFLAVTTAWQAIPPAEAKSRR